MEAESLVPMVPMGTQLVRAAPAAFPRYELSVRNALASEISISPIGISLFQVNSSYFLFLDNIPKRELGNESKQRKIKPYSEILETSAICLLKTKKTL